MSRNQWHLKEKNSTENQWNEELVLWKKINKIDKSLTKITKETEKIHITNIRCYQYRQYQYILREISPGCSLEGLMLKLKLEYFGHLMWRVDSLERPWSWEGLGAGGEGDDRGWDGWMASPTRWTWVWVNSRSWWWTGRPGMLRFMGSRRVGHDWVTELNWTEYQYRLCRHQTHNKHNK